MYVDVIRAPNVSQSAQIVDLCEGRFYKTQNKVDLGCDNKNLNIVLFPYKVFLNLLLKDDTYFSICNSRHPTPEQTAHYLPSSPHGEEGHGQECGPSLCNMQVGLHTGGFSSIPVIRNLIFLFSKMNLWSFETLHNHI